LTKNVVSDRNQSVQPADATTVRLRRERNGFAVGAVAMIVIAMAIALPRRVQRYRMHKGLNSELLDLQTQIGGLQLNIKEVEKKITAAQQEIQNLRTAAH
jgi:hypothetical protein